MGKLMRSVALATAFVAVTALVPLASPAKANTYTFSFISDALQPSFSISGNITTLSVLNGGTPNGYDITSITGSMIDPSLVVSSISGPLGGTATLPGSNNIGWSLVDNILIPTTPFASTTAGWAFSSTNGHLYNIYAGGASYGSAGKWYLYGEDGSFGAQAASADNGFGVVGTLSVSQTPLPSTWTMLIAGFVGLGFMAYRSKKNPARLAAA